MFFVRHNGGSVWFDELGWPWPVHPCFADAKVARKGSPSLFAVHESTDTTVRVSDALVDLVGRTANARIGVVKRVVVMGNWLRIAVVATGDGEDLEVAVEQRVAPTKLFGAIAVYAPLDCLVSFHCNDRAIRGWWWPARLPFATSPPREGRAQTTCFRPISALALWPGKIKHRKRAHATRLLAQGRAEHRAHRRASQWRSAP